MFHTNILEKVIQSRTGHLSLKVLRMYENPTDEQHSVAYSVLVDRRSVTPPAVLKPVQPLAGPVQHSTTLQASSTTGTHSTSLVPSTLFGSAQNCTINLQVFNQPSIQNFQGINISSTVPVDTEDDMFVDSLLSSSDMQL